MRDPNSQRVHTFTGQGAYAATDDPPQQELGPMPAQTPAPLLFNETSVRPVAILPQPTQDEIRSTKKVFCWTPMRNALIKADGPTKAVLQVMQQAISGVQKNHIYVDSKVQWLEEGDVPVDNTRWHVDGSVTLRGTYAQKWNRTVVHHMERSVGPGRNHYLAYHSSTYCATEYVQHPTYLRLNPVHGDFQAIDEAVESLRPHISVVKQPPDCVVSFDNTTLHRAVPSTKAHWRLWIRMVATDDAVHPRPLVQDCYQTVFRP